MAYTINLTNGTVLTTIPDGTVNTQACSLTLIGKNYAGYGQFLDDNFVHLLENAANSSAPGTPLTGQLWYNTASKTLSVYNGTVFKGLAVLTPSATAPTSSSITGELWYDTTNAQLNVFSGVTNQNPSGWTIVGPIYTTTTGKTGVIPGTILDNTSVNRIVANIYVSGNVVGIISDEPTFTPQTGISGFTTVRPGITLSTAVNSQVPLFQGTATNALQFGGLSSGQLMRSDTNTSTSGTLGVINDAGLTVGLNGTVGVSVNGTTAFVTNKINNGSLNIQANVAGTPTNAINVNGSTGVVTIPNLSVTGNVAFPTATGNVTFANVTTTGSMSAGGNVYGSYLYGNGSQLTGIVTSTNPSFATVTATGNVTAGQLNTTYANTASFSLVQVGTKLYFKFGSNIIASLDSNGNLITSNNITAFSTP